MCGTKRVFHGAGGLLCGPGRGGAMDIKSWPCPSLPSSWGAPPLTSPGRLPPLGDCALLLPLFLRALPSSWWGPAFLLGVLPSWGPLSSWARPFPALFLGTSSWRFCLPPSDWTRTWSPRSVPLDVSFHSMKTITSDLLWGCLLAVPEGGCSHQ